MIACFFTIKNIYSSFDQNSLEIIRYDLETNRYGLVILPTIRTMWLTKPQFSHITISNPFKYFTIL